MNEKSTAVKLGFGRQLGFALGESAGQFFFGFWGSFLSLYYTDVVGLAPAIVSVIFIIARIWDAVNYRRSGQDQQIWTLQEMDLVFCAGAGRSFTPGMESSERGFPERQGYLCNDHLYPCRNGLYSC